MTIKALKINSYLVGILYGIAFSCKIFLMTIPNEKILFIFSIVLSVIIICFFSINMISEIILELIDILTPSSNKHLNDISSQIKKTKTILIISLYLRFNRINKNYFKREQDECLLKIYKMIDDIAPRIMSENDILIFKKQIESFYYRKSRRIPTINTEKIELGNISSMGWGIFKILSEHERLTIANLMGKIFNRSDRNISTMSKKLKDAEFKGAIQVSHIKCFT